MNASRLSLVIATVVAALAAACTVDSASKGTTPAVVEQPADAEPHADAAIDTRDSATSSSDAAKDSGTCTGLTNGGARVPQTNVATDAPVATGGTIATGTYDLTSWSIYTTASGTAGPTGEQKALTLRITAGNHVEALDVVDGTPMSGTFTTSGTTVTSTFTCPKRSVVGPLTYTAIANELRLASIPSAGEYVEEYVLTRRP